MGIVLMEVMMDFIEHLDIQTLYRMMMYIQFIIAVIMVMIYTMGRKKYVLVIALGHFMSGVGLVMIFAQISILMAVGDFLSLLAFIVVAVGIVGIMDVKQNYKHLVIWLLLLTTAIMISTILVPSPWLRQVVHTVTQVIATIYLCSKIILKIKKSPNSALVILILLYLGFTIISIYRLVDVVLIRKIFESYHVPNINKIFLLYGIGASAIRTFIILIYNTLNTLDDEVY